MRDEMRQDAMSTRDVIPGKVINFQVLGRAEIARVSPQDPHILISVTEPGAPEVHFAEAPSRLGVLRLTFHDAQQPSPDRILLSAQDAEAIIAFVREYQASARLIVCQCEGGISRSAGIAAALSRWLQGDDAPFFLYFEPNA